MVRTAAVDRLAQEVNCPLTVVSAPAGYGKTTALAQLIATLHVPAAWVTLDARDNDPARFWARVFAALEHVIPGLDAQGHATRTTHEAPGLSATDRVLDALAVWRPHAQESAPTLLILDDYHELHAENHVIHDAVAFLVEHLPPQLHLVVAGRTVPPLPLAKLRARDQLLELGTADLRLTLAETRALLDKRTGLDLSDEDIAVLHARTEGWVSALQLAALSLREQSDPRGWIAGFSGENRYIFDYLVQEVIKYIPSHMYHFALHVALLDRLCGPLCDAVTRRSDSQAMLEEMERYHLFLVPLDDRREWYRLHHLFADVLRRHLRQTRPRLVPRLYARASAWCEAGGLALDAIDYAFEAHELEVEHTAQLVEGYVPAALANGYFVLLRERLERLPDRVVRERPVLAVAHAFALFMTGDRWVWLRRIREAEEAFVRTEHLLDVSEREIARAQIGVLRTAAQITLGESSLREAIATLRQAQGVLPRQHAFQTVIELYLGIGLLLDGDVRAARQAFDDLARSSEASGNRFLVAYTVLLHGIVMLTAGRLDDALALCSRLSSHLQGYGDENLEALIHVLRGRVLYERNDLEQALRGLEYGISSVRYNRGTYLMEIAPTLAYTLLALGNASAAHEVIDAAFAEWEASQAEQRPLLVWTGRHILAHRARLWLLEGDVEAAAAWARGLTSSGGSPAASTAEQSPYVREWEEIVLARLYLAEHRASDALALLDRLDEAAQAAGRMARLLEVLVLKVAALDDLGDSAAALRELQRAVELSKPQDIVRTF
ncbi:MAG TPA: AAA family ATPase, partial [Ktedonobacterales bacterium]|nr:AAA family ATPase [Ktedonobacterales bacterium]